MMGLRKILMGSSILAVCLTGATCLTPEQGNAATVSSIQKTAAGLELSTADGFLVVEPWSDNDIHIRFSTQPNWPGNYNPSVIAHPGPVAWTVDETPDAYQVKTAALTVLIERATGQVLFLDKSGDLILAESGDNARSVSASGRPKQEFYLDAWQSIYGLGQHQTGLLDYRGSSVLLEQINTDVAIPMLVSSKGYGILWNNAAITHVDVATPQNANNLRITSEAGTGIDYHFIYGPELDDVVAGYRNLTGQAPMMARWTWGLWQSKERYSSQDELVSVASRYRQMGVPLDAVVQDWQYWGKDGWGSHEFDASRFPDPRAMVKTLHDQHTHAIISVWPRFDLATTNLRELDEAGAMFPKVYDNVYPKGVGRWYDAYSAKGREIYWRQIMTQLGKYNFDGWWLDGAEAELGGVAGMMSEVKTSAGPGSEVFNAFPLLHTTAVHDGMKRDMPDKRAFILTRSSYAGQQRNAAITWSGDTVGNWDIFAKQIPAALNFSISGIPYWSADIGGFFGGDPKSPEYAELFTRWYQFGVFNPMFRVHGTGAGKEIWAFDDKTQDTLIAYDKLRYRLLPYIYSTSWEVTNRAGTMMRPLAMDFRKDMAALTIRDQYMFGRSLLVSPVVQPHTDVRTVYLPEGEWYDFWTGAKHNGGKVIAAKADLKTIPVFVPAGSVLPLGPDIQYADEKSAEAAEIRVYPGHDGEFELYDDQGDGYGYESGEYATIHLKWDNADRLLTLSKRIGRYPGMAEQQSFRISCASDLKKTKNFTYTGTEMTIPFINCN